MTLSPESLREALRRGGGGEGGYRFSSWLQLTVMKVHKEVLRAFLQMLEGEVKSWSVILLRKPDTLG